MIDVLAEKNPPTNGDKGRIIDKLSDGFIKSTGLR